MVRATTTATLGGLHKAQARLRRGYYAPRRVQSLLPEEERLPVQDRSVRWMELGAAAAGYKSESPGSLHQNALRLPKGSSDAEANLRRQPPAVLRPEAEQRPRCACDDWGVRVCRCHDSP